MKWPENTPNSASRMATLINIYRLYKYILVFQMYFFPILNSPAIVIWNLSLISMCVQQHSLITVIFLDI